MTGTNWGLSVVSLGCQLVACAEPEVDRLPGGVHRFAGTEFDQPVFDLAPLGEMVEGADLVGLGEAVHTSGGFYAVKRRLIRYLVVEHGFRALAMETPRTAAEATAAYVERCEGTSRQALGGIFAVFADDNTQRLLEDLCAYNQEHPDDPVRFYGYDVQQPADDRDALAAFLDANLPDEADELMGPVDASCELDFSAVEVQPERHVACLAALDAVDDSFDEHDAEWSAALGDEAVAFARLAPLGLRSWQDEVAHFTSDLAASYQARDSAMAQVFVTQRTYRYPEKTVVWAHDYHLRERSLEATDYPVIDALGSQLARTYGDAYRPFGISAMQVGINWPGVGCGDLPMRSDTVETRLAALGTDDYLVDFAPTDEDATPLLADGEVVAYGLDGSADQARQFRGLVVLAESPPMTSAMWPQCEP